MKSLGALRFEGELGSNAESMHTQGKIARS